MKISKTCKNKHQKELKNRENFISANLLCAKLNYISYSGARSKEKKTKNKKQISVQLQYVMFNDRGKAGSAADKLNEIFNYKLSCII